MGKKAKSNAGKRKALERKIDKSTLPPPPPKPEDEVRKLEANFSCHEKQIIKALNVDDVSAVPVSVHAPSVSMEKECHANRKQSSRKLLKSHDILMTLIIINNHLSVTNNPTTGRIRQAPRKTRPSRHGLQSPRRRRLRRRRSRRSLPPHRPRGFRPTPKTRRKRILYGPESRPPPPRHSRPHGQDDPARAEGVARPAVVLGRRGLRGQGAQRGVRGSGQGR